MNREERVFFHKTMTVECLISSAAKHIDLLDCCNPELLLIWNEGHRNDREMMHTLFCYLRHMKSVSEAARELHIHRSTLVYRVNKIAAQAHLDLDDGATVHHVLLTQDILRYLTHRPS